MATVAISAMPLIPGLQSHLTVDDMNQGNDTYNGLSRIHPDMCLSQDHVNNLLAIFDRHGMSEKLGFHLLHRHDSLPDGQIKLEMKLETVPGGKWNKPTLISSLDLNNIHGTMFSFAQEQGRLVPYEFAKGPSPVSKDNSNYVKDFVDYIINNNLGNKIALQVLNPVEDGRPKERTAEVEVGTKNGTVALPVSMVKNPNLLSTGWSGAVQQPNDPDPQPGPNETWQKQVTKDKESHRVFISQAQNEEELLQELVQHDLIDV